MWSRLKELNENFAKMKEHKKIIKRKRFACNLNIYFYHTYICKLILIKKLFFVEKKMTGFISLPRNRIHKKKETKRLKNLPSNFAESFYKDWLDGIDFSQDTDFQQQLMNNTPSEVVSEFGEEIQGETDLYVTNNRLNEASFRHRLDPISKNIIKNQNPIELLFKDVKHFDAQNPVIGSLIREVEIGRKKDWSKFIDKAPDVRDLELWSRLNKLRN